MSRVLQAAPPPAAAYGGSCPALPTLRAGRGGGDRPARRAALEAEGRVEGDDFTIVNAEGDAATQQSQAEQAIADGAAAIILASVDTASGATSLDTGKAA